MIDTVNKHYSKFQYFEKHTPPWIPNIFFPSTINVVVKFCWVMVRWLISVMSVVCDVWCVMCVCLCAETSLCAPRASKQNMLVWKFASVTRIIYVARDLVSRKFVILNICVRVGSHKLDGPDSGTNLGWRATLILERVPFSGWLPVP